MEIQTNAAGLVSQETSRALLAYIFPNYPDTTECHALPDYIKEALWKAQHQHT